MNIKDKYFNIETIPDRINKEGKYQGMGLFSFKETQYQDLDDMLEKIKQKTKEPGKKYIYAYKICPPDKTDRHITTYLYRIKSENGVYLVFEYIMWIWTLQMQRFYLWQKGEKEFTDALELI